MQDHLPSRAPAGPGQILLGAGAGAVDLAGWLVRPWFRAGFRAARTVAGALDPTGLCAEILAERGRLARAELNALIDLLARRAVLRVLVAVDLTALVREHVDLDAVAEGLDLDAIIGRVDFDAVLSQVDLAAVAGQVIDSVDLPGIVRDSSGTLASEAVHGVRIQAMQADDALARLVDRVLRRHRADVTK